VGPGGDVWLWASVLSTNNVSDQEMTAMFMDDSGNSFVVAIQNTSASILLMRYDLYDGPVAAPSLTWSRESVSTGTITATSLAVGVGSFLVAGAFTGELVDFQGTKTQGMSDQDAYLAVYNLLDGTPQGISTASSSSSATSRSYKDDAAEVAVDNAGNMWLAGTFGGFLLTIQPPASSGTGPLRAAPSFQGTSNCFLAKFDPSGRPLWVRTSDGGFPAQTRGVVATQEGEAIILGEYKTLSPYFYFVVDPALSPLQSLAGVAGPDLFIAKFATNGPHYGSHRLLHTGR
jgi:hypothetical protein